eukprot:GHUV01042621.1.p1 GENE.GHUV01042621.1~~GHUV01042621.1.p1  ORF type:complete len:139 (+),score=20.00 GHUV01042621.1:406-822(+)
MDRVEALHSEGDAASASLSGCRVIEYARLNVENLDVLSCIPQSRLPALQEACELSGRCRCCSCYTVRLMLLMLARQRTITFATRMGFQVTHTCLAINEPHNLGILYAAAEGREVVQLHGTLRLAAHASSATVELLYLF